jgi:hypothetical protein
MKTEYKYEYEYTISEQVYSDLNLIENCFQAIKDLENVV